MNVKRIDGFSHLLKKDLVRPAGKRVFFDPADTELGVWVAADLIYPGSTVLDLGCGSGAAAAAMARLGAGRVHGVDISEESIGWAKEHYAVCESNGVTVSFAVGDYSTADTYSLVSTAYPTIKAVDVVTSNPAYVPLTSASGQGKPSIYGGQDGLKWADTLIGHASALNTSLGLTIGSYSTPRKAVELIQRAGYGVTCVTLSSLPLGKYTIDNFDQIRKLEGQREAVVWRPGPEPRYFLVGLACKTRSQFKNHDCTLTGADLMNLLFLAAEATTMSLETLSNSVTAPVPVRVVRLPDVQERHHW